ncbi:MAG: hypothetical protein H6715_05930 [Myxococcales bacterium]|nr:hypothetical protein [Myxococcales bacterium]MCB9708317.1 hypothetical protein [Myxococcales bacterium]
MAYYSDWRHLRCCALGALVLVVASCRGGAATGMHVDSQRSKPRIVEVVVTRAQGARLKSLNQMRGVLVEPSTDHISPDALFGIANDGLTLEENSRQHVVQRAGDASEWLPLMEDHAFVRASDVAVVPDDQARVDPSDYWLKRKFTARQAPLFALGPVHRLVPTSMIPSGEPIDLFMPHHNYGLVLCRDWMPSDGWLAQHCWSIPRRLNLSSASL